MRALRTAAPVPRTPLASLLAAAGCLLLLGCEQGSPFGGPVDPPCTCSADEDCPPYYECRACLCASLADAGVSPPSRSPRIAVEPRALDFGPWVPGSELTLPVIVRSTGEADLWITAIRIEEPGLLPELSAVPEGARVPPLALPPGASLRVDVTLRQQDAELDMGVLVFESNDPEQPILRVELTSGCTCVPALEVCARDPAAVDPDPFGQCVVRPEDGEPLLDFGVAPAEDASRLLVARNVVEGNPPLVLSDVAVFEPGGPGGAFELEIFTLEEDPLGGGPWEVPASLPVYLRAADPLLEVPADLLWIRLWYRGVASPCFPEAQLLVTSNDPEGVLTVPVTADASACGPP